MNRMQDRTRRPQLCQAASLLALTIACGAEPALAQDKIVAAAAVVQATAPQTTNSPPQEGRLPRRRRVPRQQATSS
jgi:hypothetical protein